MKRAFLPACLLLAAISVHAQQQEEGLSQRLNAKWNMKQVSPMQNKNFEASTLATRSFGTSAYSGLKGAQLKTFTTRSFLGITNPWFGNRVFKTDSNRTAQRNAKESNQKFQTDAFAVRDYDKSRKKNLVDADSVLPNSVRPRTYRGPEQPDKREGIDKFTQNLNEELSIDDVRDLLNKGKSE